MAKDTAQHDVKYAAFGACLLIGLLLIAVGHIYSKFTSQQELLEQTITNSRKVYVYSLEEVLVKVEALNNKHKFDENILKLNDELLKSEEKIKNIKNAKLQEDFSDVYLKNLRLKRDELVNDYQKSIEELTVKINQALAEIAQEKDVPAVFLKSAIAVTTPHVVDLTDEVVARMQQAPEQK